MTSTVTASQESSQKSPNPLTGLSLCHAPQEALKTQQPTNQCVCVLVASLTCSLSMGFSRQEYWSGVPFPSPADLPNPGVKPRSFALQADSLTSEPGEFPGVFFFFFSGFRLSEKMEEPRVTCIWCYAVERTKCNKGRSLFRFGVGQGGFPGKGGHFQTYRSVEQIENSEISLYIYV